MPRQYSASRCWRMYVQCLERRWCRIASDVSDSIAHRVTQGLRVRPLIARFGQIASRDVRGPVQS
jgi:hypothetical protein